MKLNFATAAGLAGTLFWRRLAGRGAWLLLLAWSVLVLHAANAPFVRGQYLPGLKTLQPTGRLAATNRLHLAIGLPLRNSAGLTHLLRQISDPRSPEYRHYLTPAQFAEKFGPPEEDYQAVIAFARAHHLQVTRTHTNRLLLDVSGTARDVETALGVTLHTYQHPTEKRLFYAPDAPPSLDLSVPILGIGGLDNYARPHPHVHATRLVAQQQKANARPLNGSGPNGTWLSADFRAAYAPNTVLNGSGQVIGLVQFDGYTAADITAYENAAGLPNVPLQNVLLDDSDGQPTYTGGEVETSLDIEMAISMATNISAVIVYEAGPYGNWEDVLNQMADDDSAGQLSCSWYIPGGGADPVADQIFQQMAVQGQTFFDASGDQDAFTSLIDFPGDSPYITQVGGTTLATTTPGGAWSSETVWNWGIEYGLDGVGSGGGVSTQYPIPDWQTNVNMAANLGSTSMRNTPDVAMVADNVYVRADGADYSAGGTSCAAPLWAGFTALVNQQAAASGQASAGFINPALYALGAGPVYPTAFHDVIAGSNTWSASPNLFEAVPGYDLCTGWGTPAGQSLINALANPEPLAVVPAAGFASVGGAGGPFTVTTQTFWLSNLGTNTLTWTSSSAPAWLNVAPNNGTLLPGGTATVVNVSLTVQASNLAVGNYYSTLMITNLNDNSSQSRSFSLSIISPPQIIQQPVNQAVLEGAPATFVVQAAGGLPLAFQWKFNGTNLVDGGNIAGSLTTNLTVGVVSPAEVGTYTVAVTNYAGSIISSNAGLAITPSPPVITVQPAGQTVIAGTGASFSVAAIGSPPFTYQWSLDRTNLANATNAWLTLVNVQSNEAGNYAVLIGNSHGSTLSSNAVLSVNNVPVVTGFSPAAGSPGTLISVTGVNFAPAPASNIIYFGAVKGTAVSASSTNLAVSVPSGATFAPITVTVNGLTAASATPFLPSFPGIGPLGNSSLGGYADLNAGGIPGPIAIGDLDGDGKPDLVVGNSGDNTLMLYLNISTNGSLSAGSFAPPVVLSVGGVSALALADLDGDGRLDIVVADENDNLVTVFQNLSQPGSLTTNSFAPPVNFPVGAQPLAVVAGDLDGDGRPEIITANAGDDTVSVLQNLGAGGGLITTNTFGPDLTWPTPAGPSGLALGDLDGDGRPDLVTANESDSISVVSILQNESSVGHIAFASRVDLPGNVSEADAVVIGDMDGDGKPDLVSGSFDGQTVSVYANTGTPGAITSGSFAPTADFAAGGEIPRGGLALADLEGDGKLDVAAATENSSKLSLFSNTSSPGLFSLGPRQDFTSGYTPAGLAIGDLIGDGRPDIVCADAFDDSLTLYQNLITMGSLPVITLQPTNQAVPLAGTATFAIAATGSPPLNYQWWFNQTNALPGATNALLTITNVQTVNAGIYAVTVTNSFGSCVSSNAMILLTGQLDHFAWNTIPSPRFVNAPFPATIQALDAVNQPVTHYTGTVSLASTNGVPVNPPSSSFVNGAWTGTVNIPQTVSNLVLQASDGGGHAGLANPINVVAAPSLGVGRSAGSLLIFWPMSPNGFVLEVSTNLAAGQWETEGAPPLQVGGQFLESIQLGRTNQFYRLRYTLP